MEEIIIGENKHSLVRISGVPEGISIPELRDNGACLPNSVLCARQNEEIFIVEGLVFVVPKDKEKYIGGIFKHAWNLKENIHFDLTAEHIWGNEYEELYYYGLLSKEEKEYGGNEVEFDEYVIDGKAKIENQIQEAFILKDNKHK